MTWWTSIAFYLWRNSFRRWIEQPLGVLSKLAIASLIGMFGSVMIAGASYLGDELGRQLASRDALAVTLLEMVPGDQANAMLAPEDSEEGAWESLAGESLTFYQVSAVARIDGTRDVSVFALRDLELHGYPDTLVLLTHRQPAGTMVVGQIDTLRFEALAMPPAGALVEKVVGKGEVLIGSVARFSPMLQRGFTRQVVLQAKSLEAIEQAQRVTEVMQSVEQRRVTGNPRSAALCVACGHAGLRSGVGSDLWRAGVDGVSRGTLSVSVDTFFWRWSTHSFGACGY